MIFITKAWHSRGQRFDPAYLHHKTPHFLWFYVNSWGREKKQIIAIRVGVKAPARILCMAEEDPVSEIAEVTHSKAYPFQGFGFIIASFNKAI